MTPEYADFLAHYGVKGQKWGTRNWQNADGSYTEAGKHHYGWGYGRLNKGGINPNQHLPRRPGMKVDGYQSQRKAPGTRSVQRPEISRQPTREEIEARKAKTRKIIAIGAGVAVAAALTYAAYRGSTNLRNNMRADVFKRFNTDPNSVHTMNSKFWTSADRAKYSELTAERAKTVSQNLTRRDAIASKIYDKTGVQVKMPQSRQRVLEQRRSEMNYSNFIRDAEKRGQLNRSIHDARADLKSAQKRLSTYQDTAHIGTSKQYESMFNAKYAEQVDAARERLNSLLKMRRAG